MLKGVHLTLLIGPGIALPAPQPVTDALISVQVTNGKDRGGFQLMFAVDKQSVVFNTLLQTGYFRPVTTRVIVIATLNGFPNVLMDGLITQQELSPSNQPGQSHLTITGEDLSLAMDLVQKIVPMPSLPEAAQINLALAPYAALGVIPLVIQPFIPVVKTPMEQWKTQRSTDRAFIQALARRCGFIFCLQPGPLPGQSIAYFGPDLNLPIPQPALSINLDGHSTVESLSFTQNGLVKQLGIYTILDPITGKIPIPVPVPNISPFKPPLGLVPPAINRVVFANDVAGKDLSEAAQQILGELLNAPAEVSGNGSLDVLRYKHILRARMLVGVRGAGLAYDGLYYVDSVTHSIKRGEYKQNFTLSRDGMVANTPVVLP